MHSPRIVAVTFALILLTVSTHAEAARRPTRTVVRASASSISSSSVKATVRPSRRRTLPTRSQSSSAAKVTKTYPINLLTNPEWRIKVISQFDDFTGHAYVFDVRRSGESFTVTEQKKDLKSGKLERSPTKWRAEFETDYHTPSVAYLELYQCWFKYEYIQEGFSCEFHRIPVQIGEAAVTGDWSFEHLVAGANDEYTVEILSKSSKDVPCNVKAETTDDGSKVYYSKDSMFFNEASGFQCFESADAAKKAGYKQSQR